MEYLFICYWAVVIIVALWIAFCFLWFVVGIIRIWWTIYKAPRLKPRLKVCKHHNTCYAENSPGRVWCCCDCGEKVKP